MHFSTIIAAALVGASTTIAIPASAKRSIVCPGIAGTPECCAVNALGVADLDCAPPPMLPTNLTSFTKMCAAEGQQAQCCFIPILGQGLVCESPP